ncbi:MAG: ABC transporter permease subunit [Spirochaetaceae bacterium]
MKIRKSLSQKRKYQSVKQGWFIIFMIPSVLLLGAFIYLPMYGLQLAFKSFDASLGIWGSPWSGFENFKFLFNSPYALRATKNTVFLNLLFILSTHLFAVFCAIGLYEVRSKMFRKTITTITYFPSFLSWVVLGIVSTVFLSQSTGIFNKVLVSTGFEAVSWYRRPELWPGILTAIVVWKQAGVQLIIYSASLLAISPEYHEAAKIDGAGFWARVRHVTLPHLMPTIIILMILAVGNIFRGDQQMMVALINNRSQLFPTTDVLDFFVYRSLVKTFDVGMPTAIGLYQSIVGFVLVLFANKAARKYQSDGALF